MSAIDAFLKRGNADFAADQILRGMARVESESPVRGCQPLKLAAGELAIALAAKTSDGEPEQLADRLIALSHREDQNYAPRNMLEEVLTDEEKLFYPSAAAIVGLIADALSEERR